MTERALLKQPKVFFCTKKSGKAKRPGMQVAAPLQIRDEITDNFGIQYQGLQMGNKDTDL